MIGTSVEVSASRWEKAEVTLDETDLRRIARSEDLADPESWPLNLAFLMADTEANRLLVHDLRTRDLLTPSTAKEVLGGLDDRATAIKNKIRESVPTG